MKRERGGRESADRLAHAYDPSRVMEDCLSFETSLAYVVSSRKAGLEYETLSQNKAKQKQYIIVRQIEGR